jgi:predicted membrane protein
MGSTTLDLRDTVLPPGRLKIDALAIMGELKIIVPPGLPVKMTAFPFMGEANVHRSVERRVVRGEPYLEGSGVALMGSIVVKAI